MHTHRPFFCPADDRITENKGMNGGRYDGCVLLKSGIMKTVLDRTTYDE
jgi:hypothetical protein